MELHPLSFGTNRYNSRTANESLCRGDMKFCPLLWPTSVDLVPKSLPELLLWLNKTNVIYHKGHHNPIIIKVSILHAPTWDLWEKDNINVCKHHSSWKRRWESNALFYVVHSLEWHSNTVCWCHFLIGFCTKYFISVIMFQSYFKIKALVDLNLTFKLNFHYLFSHLHYLSKHMVLFKIMYTF